MFSYKDYEKIIEFVKESGKEASFSEAKDRDSFVIMRHDVEFSVDRAFELAQLEKSMDLTSTYFFQWTNNAYNLLSKKNREMIEKMHEQGHTIGLHYAVNGLTDIIEIKKQIMLEINSLSSMLDFDINSFSIHRPSRDLLAANITLEGITNAYDKHFFTFADHVDENTKLDVKYFSDAQHQWNYGYPTKEAIMGNKKIQILTHPYSWTKEGYDNLHNFQSLIAEMNEELINTINGECKHFASIKDQL